MKSLINWHRLYDLLLDIVGGLNPSVSLLKRKAFDCIFTLSDRTGQKMTVSDTWLLRRFSGD